MDFLDYLARIMGCEYLSDLRFRVITPEEAKWILSLSADMFPLGEYQEAARYLIGPDADYPSLEAARRAVVSFLRHKTRV